MSNLRTSLEIFKVIKERLATEFDLAIDDAVVIDTAEGECDLSDVVAKLIREARYAEAQALGVKSLMAEMGERMDRLFAKSKKLRDIAHHAMQEAGLKNVSRPDFTITMSAGKAPLVITRDPDGLDAEVFPDLVDEKTTYAWNKAALRKEMDGNGPTSFAYLGNANSIMTVRGK